VSDASKRRPIASREWRLSKRLAAALAARHVSPNAISVAGMIAGLLGGACFAATSHWDDYASVCWVLGAACVQLRLIANMLDGMVAVLSDRCSPVGELYNEVPDRVSDTAIFVGLGYAAGGTAPLGFAAALAAMFTAYVRTTCVTAGAPPDFRGPMAKQHRMFLVTCLAIYALFGSTSTRLASIGDYPITPVVVTLGAIIIGSVVTAVRRLAGSSRLLRREARNA
jgi:phosphatidylglycerophosphate synthase